MRNIWYDNFMILEEKANYILLLIGVITDLHTGLMPAKDILSLQTIKLYTGLSNSLLYQEIATELIPHSKQVGKIYIPLESFITWYLKSYVKFPKRRIIMEHTRENLLKAKIDEKAQNTNLGQSPVACN